MVLLGLEPEAGNQAGAEQGVQGTPLIKCIINFTPEYPIIGTQI